MIFQYIQIQLEPFNIWLQCMILEKDKQPNKGIVEIDLQIEDLKSEIINLVNYLIDKYNIQDFNRLFIHCGTGDFYFSYGEKLTKPNEKGDVFIISGIKQTEPISLEQLTSEKVEIIRNIVSQLIKFKKSDFDNTDLFYTEMSLMNIKEYKNAMRKAGYILTDEEANEHLKNSKIKLDKFIKKRPDLYKKGKEID